MSDEIVSSRGDCLKDKKNIPFTYKYSYYFLLFFVILLHDMEQIYHEITTYQNSGEPSFQLRLSKSTYVNNYIYEYPIK